MRNAEQEIFAAALELDDERERDAFLDQACAGQPKLRQRIRALLSASEQAGNFLAEAPSEIREGPGARIGGYRLVERIGEGGFGVIYRAEQDEPVRRTVALKIIKLGMDTQAVIARFAAERQALAMMEHPHIARVFDAGATETGRPYFVMELVRGVPITTYCNERRLGIKARLEVFLQVCRAVHHAHQKGVIHRDLKPTNILISVDDGGRPVAKVIDFGIAKATFEPLTDLPLQTRLFGYLGTPAYMSPEQMGVGGRDVDTRSDIYSLGALLYELLTDATPFAVRGTPSTGYAELLQLVQQGDPPPPSRRLATLPAESRRAVALGRDRDPERLVADLRGDLDRIVLKCLEKDRARRYETTEDLGRDVWRYLTDEPVLARPPTLAYRTSKFVRRHRGGVIAAGVATLLLLTLAAYHARRLAEERDRARLEARKAEKVSELLTGILTASDPFRTPTREGVLEDSAARVRTEFAGHPQMRVEILNAIGRVHLRRGEHLKARPILEESLAAGRTLPSPDLRLAQTLSDLGILHTERGDFATAVPLLTEALSVRRAALGTEHNDVAISMVELGRAQLALERLDLAESLFREALAIRRRVLGEIHRETAVSWGDLANLLWYKGDLAAAEPMMLQSLSVHRQTVGPSHPNTGNMLTRLAALRAEQGRLEEADALATEGEAILGTSLGAAHWRLARAHLIVGDIRRRQGRLDEAAALLDRARANARAAFGEDHPLFAGLEVERAHVALDAGQAARAEALLQHALAVQLRTAPSDGWTVANTRGALGGALLALGREGEARPLLVQAAAVLRDVAGPQGREFAATRARLARLRAVAP